MKAFAKFITKYAGELSVVRQGLSLILASLPVPRDEKARVIAAVDGLEENVKSLVQSAKDLQNVSFALDANEKRQLVEAITAQVVDKLPGIVQGQLERLTAPDAAKPEGEQRQG